MRLDWNERKKYLRLWNELEAAEDEGIVRIIHNIARAPNSHQYDNVSKKIWWNLGIPFPPILVGILHRMESDANFATHLHNGDPMWDSPQGEGGPDYPLATTSEPKGRGPFGSWEESAFDAIQMKLSRADLSPLRFKRVDEVLYFFEAYNGFGYRKHAINSPYLWGRTNHYRRGKYTVDGAFDATSVAMQPRPGQVGAASVTAQIGAASVTAQIGAAAIFRAWLDGGWNSEHYEDGVICNDPPLLTATIGPDEIEDLQELINDTIERLRRTADGFVGEILMVDGKVGPKTRTGYKRTFGVDLLC